MSERARMLTRGPLWRIQDTPFHYGDEGEATSTPAPRMDQLLSKLRERVQGRAIAVMLDSDRPSLVTERLIDQALSDPPLLHIVGDIVYTRPQKPSGSMTELQPLELDVNTHNGRMSWLYEVIDLAVVTGHRQVNDLPDDLFQDRSSAVVIDSLGDYSERTLRAMQERGIYRPTFIAIPNFSQLVPVELVGKQA